MIHPDTELRFINPDVGYGVFATADIPEGTIVYAKDELDIEIPANSPLVQRPEYNQLIQRWSYLERGAYVICWDIEKYVNHSCDSNKLNTGYGFEIAIRDIKKDEELTDDYGALNMDYDFQCMCGSPKCRGTVYRHDFEAHIAEWDRKLQAAFKRFNSVEQPLLSYLSQETYQALMQYLETGNYYRSINEVRDKVEHVAA